MWIVGSLEGARLKSDYYNTGAGFRRTTFRQSSNEYSKCYAHVIRACEGTCEWCSTEVEGHILH